MGDGAASYLSICSGRKDTESAHKCVGTGITTTFLISVVFMTLCIAFANPLMSLFGASDQTLGMAVEYFVIVASFFPFYLLLNVMNSMIRADGSPTYAMIAMLTGAIINIGVPLGNCGCSVGDCDWPGGIICRMRGVFFPS